MALRQRAAGWLAKRFGARVRALRKAKGMTVRELAAKTGITPNAMSKLETGHREARNPGFYKMERAAKVLGCDRKPWFLIGSPEEIKASLDDEELL